MSGHPASGGFHDAASVHQVNMTSRELHWKFGGREIVASVSESGGLGVLHVGDRTVAFELRDTDSTGGWIEVDGQRQRFYVYRNRDTVSVWIAGRTYHLVRAQKGQSLSDTAANSSSGEIRAMMPGKILRIPVTTGETVLEKQPLVIMESMKMETTLAAPRGGTVSAVKCRVGQVVEMGELLVIVE